MRPNKPINSGAHRSGTAGGRGKSRYFSTALPSPPPETEEPALLAAPEPTTRYATLDRYEGRASVGPQSHDDGERDMEASFDVHPGQWVDPLDEDEVDLTHITIDLRETLMESPPDTYYQRHSSRIPGHQ
ncbi:MAG: hypothetical protein GY720_01230 [bacterium]|nr:hypothetical protein [bacterium]